VAQAGTQSNEPRDLATCSAAVALAVHTGNVRVSRTGCLVSIIISVVLSIALTVILNLVL
jgi:hypothetical protein